MGRHSREWRPTPDHPALLPDLEAWVCGGTEPRDAPLPQQPTYRVPTCPRCGAQRPIDYGAKLGCGECGHLWQVEPPLSPRERFAVRRRLDEQSEP